MPYNTHLANRIRQNLTTPQDCSSLVPRINSNSHPVGLISGLRKVQEMEVFGGLAFLVNGNMAIGVLKNDFFVRLSPNDYQAALEGAGAQLFDSAGKPLAGWVLVLASTHRNEPDLHTWIARSLDFVLTLPPK
jgi:TfoX/Sxy family transcriptional regulator of competence genes